MTLIESIAVMQEEMTRWRRDIHAHPELGFEETRTSDIVADKLRAFGLEVHRGIGRTGVVGVLRAGTSTRSIGLRADMDALPIVEANTFEHRSVHEGRMHACGHDGHTTMLLGAAKYLAERRNFDGIVNFIFQPAEEGIGGARAMIADGLFERFPCEAIFGMHNRPGLPVGKFAVRAGPMMAGGAFFDIRVNGKGAHGARPEAGIDPVLVASHIAVALQSIVSRNVRPVDPAVVSVTKIEGGDAYNVIPQTAKLSGTARAFTREVLDLVETNMRRVAKGTAEAFGAAADVDFRVTFAPTVNDAAHADFAASVCAEVVGAENVSRNPNLIVASEDFSFMLEQVPGCYFNIGNGAGEGACEVHNPSYDFNDDALALGATVFARIVEKRLARSG
ncbi:MAG TPA: M20 aminoacylase family protein [Burkholderiales bacterium]|nr:M20 aminoacylase family protein [Burkholderiales bacterium]